MTSQRLALFLAIALAHITPANAVLGQSKACVSVSPVKIKIRPQVKTVVDVKVDNIESFFAASITVSFDSAVLRYGNITSGPFMTRNDLNSIFLGVGPQPPPPCSPNKIIVDQAICGRGAVSGSGILFTISFTSTHTGISPVMISATDFRNEMNKKIPVITYPGNIFVNTPPNDFALVHPGDGSTFATETSPVLRWSKSMDGDTGDTVRYIVHLKNMYSDVLSSTSDTMFAVPKELLIENTEYTWYVEATDEIDTTRSLQIFHFTVPAVGQYTEVPRDFIVEQNYPNPFNTMTQIRFFIPHTSAVQASVYDIIGRNIVRFLNTDVRAGWHTVYWDGKNSAGREQGSGIYLISITAGGFNDVKKMVLLK